MGECLPLVVDEHSSDKEYTNNRLRPEFNVGDVVFVYISKTIAATFSTFARLQDFQNDRDESDHKSIVVVIK